MDTGADANVLPLNIFQKIPGPTHLKPTCIALVAYGGARLKPEGTVSLTCEMAKMKSDLQFFVTKQSSTPILGREACEKLLLVKRMEETAGHQPQKKSWWKPIHLSSVAWASFQGCITFILTPTWPQSYTAVEKYPSLLWTG